MIERPSGPDAGPEREGAAGPLPLGMVVEAGVRVLRGRVLVLLALSLLIVGPGVLLTSTIELRLTDVMTRLVPVDAEGQPTFATPDLSQQEIDEVVSAAAWFFGGSALAGLLGAIAALGFSAVTAAAIAGRRLPFGEALRACLHRALTALGIVLVTSLITVGLIALGVTLAVLSVSLGGGGTSEGGPGVFGALVVGVATVLAVVFLTVRWAMALPVAVLEDLGTRHSLARTWELTADNVWRTFAIVAGTTLVTIVFGAFIAQILGLLLVNGLSAAIGLESSAAATLASAGAAVIVAPIPAVLVAVLYHDLRVRHEGGRPLT
jgi:hypothetical protein